MPVKYTQETELEYKSFYDQNVCSHYHSITSSHTSATQETYICLTEVRQDMLGNKICEVYSGFGSSPSAKKMKMSAGSIW